VAAFSADATEVGQHIDLAAVECIATMLASDLSPVARGTRDLGAQPRGAQPASLAVQELLETSQVRASGFLEQIEHPVAGLLTYPGPPFRADAIPWQAARAPLLGEHNGEIYCGELELSRDELVVLRAGGVI
jgi:crotonobetainyl-CoA:carnitine CoA-transferase CaiB-like acyl-CoA transferase